MAITTFVFNAGAALLTSGGTTNAWIAGTIKARLVDSSVTPTKDDTSMNGMTAIGTDATLTSRTRTADTSNNRVVFDASNAVITDPDADEEYGSVVVYYFSTDDAGSTPLFCLETDPATTDGSDLTIVWEADGVGYFQTADAPVGEKTILTLSDFTYLGGLRLFEHSTENNTIGTAGNLAGRYVDGQRRLFITGNKNADPPEVVMEFTDDGLTPSLSYATAPRCTLIRNWSSSASGGDFYGGKRIVNSGEAPLTWGLYFNPLTNALVWSYSTAYTGAVWSPSFGMTVLNDSDGTSQAKGPWRCTVHSGVANSAIYEVPSDFQSAVGGRTHFIHGGVHAQAAVSPNGACLHAFVMPDPSTPADSVSDESQRTVNVQTLLGHDRPHPMSRTINYKTCARKTGAGSTHAVATGSVGAGSTTLGVDDTSIFLNAGPPGHGSGSETIVSGTFYGYVTNDLEDAYKFEYTGRSASSGAGTLTGIPSSGIGRLQHAVTAGDSVFLGNYDNNRGGETGTPSPVFNGGSDALGMDWFDSSAWIEGPTKYGVLFVGQLIETIAGHTYEDGGSQCDNWYGPNWCVHGQFAPASLDTGPGAGTIIGVGYIYSPADLLAVALGHVSDISLTPTSIFSMSELGLPAERTDIREYGQLWFDSTCSPKRLYMVKRDAENYDSFTGILCVWEIDC